MKTHTKRTSKLPRRSKPVAIKPHHARPYRKRHYALLMVSLTAAFAATALAISAQIHITMAGSEADDFVSRMLSRPAVTDQTVSSSYGFSFHYDPRRLYASAIDASSGKLYVGNELASQRAYTTIRLSNTSVLPSAGSTVEVNYYPAAVSQSLTSLERSYSSDGSQAAPVIVTTQAIDDRGLHYQRTIWRVPSAQASSLAAPLSAQFVSYTMIVNGHPLYIRTSNQLGPNLQTADIDAVVHTLSATSPAVSYQPAMPAVTAQAARSRSLLSSLIYSGASADSSTQSFETVSALYAPAVVKIYNAYCTDVSLKGQLLLTNVCSATSGSGFFISGDGYIATNGHVVTENSKDLLVSNAFTAAAAGDAQPILALARAADLDLDQLSTIDSDKVLLDTIFNAVYNLPASDFSLSNNVQNLLIGLDSKDPDVDSLLTMTKARKLYAGSDDIPRASLVSADYRSVDGTIKYRNSDVAIIKLKAAHYPVMRLGNIAEVSQGSSLGILGYPAAASNNGLVATDISQVTLTSGAVSAIKNANGDTRKLIETEATIGHGNSGGPVLDNAGNVVGIATYTIDGGGSGDGTFNYIRDIQDLRDLINDSQLHLNTQSSTQAIWQQAISAFGSAHYTKAISYFNQVKHLYPEHPTVDDFIARAQTNVREGKNVRDFPIWILVAAAALAVLMVAVAIVWIVRHHARHHIYQLAAGRAETQPATTTDRSGAHYYYTRRPVAAPARDKPAKTTTHPTPDN